MIWGLIYRALVLLSGGVLIIVLPYTTGINEQGVYYALLGIISLYMVADLGLASALVNFVSHQVFTFEGDSEQNQIALANLKRILLFSVKWMIFGSTLFIPLSILLVNNIKQSGIGALESVSYIELVILVCAACFLSFLLYVLTAFVEGLGNVSDAFLIRSIFLLLNIVFQVILLLLDVSYLSLPVAQCIGAVVAMIFLIFKYKFHFLIIIRSNQSLSTLSVKQKMVPFQGKVAISWIFGFLPIQLLPTMTIVTLGADWAARLGMTQQIVTAVSATCFLFIQYIVPKMGSLVALNQKKEVCSIFKKASFNSFIATVVFTVCSLFVVYLLDMFGWQISKRLLPFDLFFLFSSLIIVNWYGLSRATLGRVYHKEIMLVPTVLSGVSLGSLYLFSSEIDPYSFVIYYVSICWLILITVSRFQFRRFVRQLDLEL